MINASHELAEMQNYLIALVRRRMTEPEDDMLSDIITARTPEEEPLSFEELVATARALLINTHDSMLRHLPTFFSRLRRTRQSRLSFTRPPRMIRRWDVSSRNSCVSSRRCVLVASDHRAGHSRRLSLPKAHICSSSSRPPTTTSQCSNAPAIRRGRINIRKSMTFGAGVHLCLGIALARMQLLVAARQTAKRLRVSIWRYRSRMSVIYPTLHCWRWSGFH